MILHSLRYSLPVFLVAFTLALVVSADEIKLKSGETLVGRITYEGDDFLRIEISASSSIKETKMVGRGDIASITKDSPDDVAFKNIESLVPTASMISAENYRKMLETGPNTFLKNFPDSKHAEAVKKIRDTLAEELDKVERGSIKIEEDWYSPQDKVAYKELIDSRIRFARMSGFAKSNNLSGFVAAMREFEQLEKQYFGSPAFPKAVDLALQIMPNLGVQLQSLYANVDLRNKEAEQALAQSSVESRAQVQAARDREDKMYAESIAADKKAGLKWVQINPRNKSSIEEGLKLTNTDFARLKELDLAMLATLGDQLVAVDKLIAEDKIKEAQSKLAVAKALLDPKSSSSNSSPKSTPRPKGDKAKQAIPGSYVNALQWKIDDRVAEEQEKAKARAEAAKSRELAEKVAKASGPGMSEGGAEEAAAKGEDDKEKSEAPAVPVDEFSLLSGSKKSAEKSDGKSSDAKAKAAPKESKAKENTKGKAKTGPAEDDASRASSPAPVVEDDEGMSMNVIIMIGTGLLLLVLLVLKVLGVGKKKESEEE